MENNAPLPGVPENATEVYTALKRALGDIELSQEEREAVGTFVGREIPILLDTRVTSYLVLGSYRDQYHQRLRMVGHELGARRTDTSAVVLGDTAELDVDERKLPAFPVKFNLLATAADMVIMVMEKESGGEGVELGRIADGPYFNCSHVLPRDYANFTSDAIESLEDTKKAALEIWFNDTLTTSEKENAIEGLAEQTPTSAKELIEYDNVLKYLEDFLTEREDKDQQPATYSWVHLSDFRKFERAGRCYSWMTDESLREQANEIPGPDTPDWSQYED